MGFGGAYFKDRANLSIKHMAVPGNMNIQVGAFACGGVEGLTGMG